jgi:NTE family protein
MNPRVAIACLLAASCGWAQESAPRPKIGVALEGGGALGLAHIGVLEWLEKNNIPIDYIAGTSMGGLVAGMYASGKRPQEIRQLIAKIDWDRVLRGQVPFKELIYRRKEDRRAFPNDIELGLRRGFSLPAGLNPGQEIGLILEEVALPYSEIRNFDELPIPFRCVGTELTTAKSEVFKDGSFGEALRATMSIPAFFTPVKRDGKVYADGGLLNNLPVDVVKQMGADIVIAVHLQVKGYEPADIGSPFATLGRSISVVIMQNEMRSMALADLVVVVPVQEFTSMDYTRGADLADRGLNAAESKAAVLRKFSIGESAWNAYRQRIDARVRKNIPRPEFVEVQGTSPQLAASVQEELAENIGQPVEFKRLNDGAVRVTGIGRFSKIDYQVVHRDGKPGLLVKAEEKEYAPPTVLPGLVIDGSDLNNVRFTVGARVTFLDVGSYRSEIRTEVRLGGVYSGLIEYYRPFTPRSRWFVAPYAVASDSPTSLYSRGDRIAEYRSRDLGGGIDIGITPNRFSEFRAGYRINSLSLVRKIGDPNLPRLNGTAAATSLRYVVDRTDDPIVPREGHLLRSRFEIWNRNLAYNRTFPLAEADYTYVRRVSTPASVFVRGAGGTAFDNSFVGLPVFSLGGINQLSAYGLNEFLTNQFVYVEGGYLHELGRLPVIAGKRIFALGNFELAKAWGNQVSRLPVSGGAGVILETLIGPVFFGGAVGDTGHRKIFFQIGRVF